MAHVRRVRSLARQTGVALQQHGLRGGEREVEVERRRRDVRAIAVASRRSGRLSAQSPAAQAEVGIGLARLGNARLGND